MTRLYLSLLLFMLGANAAEYTLIKKSSESYRLFLKELGKYAEKHKEFELSPGSDGDHMHRAVAYALMGANEKAKQEYSAVKKESISLLPYAIKRYLLDVQLTFGLYSDLLGSVSIRECLSTKTLKQRKECRYYLGVAKYLESGEKDGNFLYASYYFPFLKKIDGEK